MGESNNEIYVFTHIPKTAGTSFVKTLVEENLRSDEILGYSTLWKLRQENLQRAKFIYGHVTYGTHHFLRRPVRYLTFLRDPIDRAVSNYFFVKDSDPQRYKHPQRDMADFHSLEDFYRLRRFGNLQTRYLAGYSWDRVHRFGNRLSDRLLLKTALAHLEKYFFVGISERFEDSVGLFGRKTGWSAFREVQPQKKTRSRPKLEQISPETREQLEASNRLDIELYQAGLRRFEAEIGDG